VTRGVHWKRWCVVTQQMTEYRQ